MILNGVRIKNFKGIQDLDFVPNKFNLLIGKSGSGKTSCLDAIRYGLTGKTTSEIRRAGTQTCSVSLDMEGKIPGEVTITRENHAEKPNRVLCNGKTTTVKSLLPVFRNICPGHSPEGVHLCTSSEVLKATLGKDLADYLLKSGAIQNDMTFEKMIALNPLSKECEKALERLLPKTPEVITLESVRMAHSNLLSNRPLIKKRIKEEGTLSNFEGVAPAKSAAEYSENLAKARNDYFALKKDADDFKRRKDDISRIERRIKEVKQEISDIGEPLVTSANKLAELKEHIDRFVADINEADLDIKTAEKDLQFLENIKNSLSSSVCPLSEKLTCKTDKSSLTGEITQKMLEKEHLIAEKGKKKEKRTALLTRANAVYENGVQQNEKSRRKAALIKELESIQSVSVSFPTEPDRKSMEKVAEEISVLEKMEETAKAYEAALEHAKLQEKFVLELAVMEELIKQTSSTGGIRKMILSHSIGPIENWINTKMEQLLPQYRMYFDAEDNFSVKLKYKNGSCEESIFFQGLSTGEQLKVISIIQAMLSELNGTKVLIFDELNAIGPDDMKAFMEFLTSVNADHCFIASVDHAGMLDAFGQVAGLNGTVLKFPDINTKGEK